MLHFISIPVRILVLLALTVTKGWTAEPTGKGHWRTYDPTDGLSAGIVYSIFQDETGHLWFGTRDGVSRYDGQTFTRFSTQDGLADNRVWSIFQDQDGALWFGTEGGASRYDGVAWETFTQKDGLAGNQVRSILRGRDGYLWISTYGSGVSRYDGEVWEIFKKKDGLADNWVRPIFQDWDGSLWFGTNGGASRYDGEVWETFTTEDGLAGNLVRSIFRDRNGSLWFGTDGGVSRYDGEVWKTFSTKDGLAHKQVWAIFQDWDGSLWFGTVAGGVSRYDGENWTTFRRSDGLAHLAVYSIFRDREGHLWFGTPLGASRYDGGIWKTFTEEDGLAGNLVRSILQDPDGSFWFGTIGGGVSRYDGEVWETFTRRDGLVDNSVNSIIQGRDGALWFGTNRGASRYDGQTFKNFTRSDGLGENRVFSIFQDRDGHFWFGTIRGGVSRYDGEMWRTFTRRDGLANNRVLSIFQDRDGSLWFGTYGGVSRYDGEVWEKFTREDGLVSNRVWSIFQDREGYLWFGTRDGVSRYDGEVWRTFTTEDGLAGVSVLSIFQDRDGSLWFSSRGGGVSRYDPLASSEHGGQYFQTLTEGDGLAENSVLWMIEDRDGQIWFATNKGVTRYRRPSPVPPPVFVDAVVANRRYEGVTEVATPSSVELVTFEFRGISFKTRPEAMFYRYRLAGYEDWQVTHARRVEYQDLPLGTYTFEVQAVDRDLVYSERPAVVHLTVHLPYERIGWISALSLAVLLVVWQTVRVVRRDLRLQQSNAELRREMAERARLDERLQHLQYLYRLRSVLGEGRSPEAVVLQAGEALMEVLSATTSAGVHIEYDGRGWDFGTVEGEGLVGYERVLSWGDRDRGRLCLFCSVGLSEVQERALLDETAAHVVRVLEARELEMQLLQSARLVSLGQMAASVAHELNQPLTVIATTAGDVCYRLVNGIALPLEELKEMMQDVREVVERMGETVDHLRVFSRDASYEPRTAFSVNEVIHNSLKIIGTQLENHDIELSLDLEEVLPSVWGHPHPMEQVFLNLLANARDALNEQPVEGNGRFRKRLMVRTRREDGRVVAEVEDNGVGMDASSQERVFEPFFTTKHADRGTGLGLSISYAIVKNHSGEILCESREGEGTVFRVKLPVEGGYAE